MRYFHGRYADVWNLAVSLHGKKASAEGTEQDKGRDKKTNSVPWPPVGLDSYPALNLPSLFPGWRVFLPEDDADGELDGPVPNSAGFTAARSRPASAAAARIEASPSADDGYGIHPS